MIQIFNTFIKKKELTDEKIKEELNSLKGQGAQVMVASMAFGVDDSEQEKRIKHIAKEMELPSTAAADITKLYGLTRRTRTAAINASILPKMLNTATSTEPVSYTHLDVYKRQPIYFPSDTKGDGNLR